MSANESRPTAGAAIEPTTIVGTTSDSCRLSHATPLRNAYRSVGLTTITTATAVLHTLTAAALVVLVVIA